MKNGTHPRMTQIQELWDKHVYFAERGEKERKTMTEFKTMTEYRKHCKENGSHWFDRDTMNFFGSRIETHLKGGRWFIESQDGGFHDEPRVYILRYIAHEKDSRGYSPIEKFASFATRADALGAFKAIPRVSIASPIASPKLMKSLCRYFNAIDYFEEVMRV
jgi:hypothetical protein